MSYFINMRHTLYNIFNHYYYLTQFGKCLKKFLLFKYSMKSSVLKIDINVKCVTVIIMSQLGFICNYYH